MKLAFFGSSEFSVYVLDELKLHNILPDLIITTPDKPKGRKLILAPTPVKVWAERNKIECITPLSLNPSTSSGQEIISKLQALSFQIFLVASYGKMIPKEVFEIPERKTLNIHPSLLPKYRGASPIQSQILNDERDVGVTIMQIEETMDTGPIVVQKLLPSPSQGEGQSRKAGWGEVGQKELEKILAIEGARLFAHILPEWLIGAIDPIIQNENDATYCEKIEKEDGMLDIDIKNLPQGNAARQCLLKIKALEDWPTAYFFINGKRIIITEAEIEDDRLKILKAIPEGKKEMPFEDFLRGQRS